MPDFDTGVVQEHLISGDTFQRNTDAECMEEAARPVTSRHNDMAGRNSLAIDERHARCTPGRFIDACGLCANTTATLGYKAFGKCGNKPLSVTDRAPVREQQSVREATGQRGFEVADVGCVEALRLEPEGFTKLEIGTLVFDTGCAVEYFEDGVLAH